MNKTDVSSNPNPNYIPPGCRRSDAISRSYAIKQIKIAIAESENEDEKLQFARFVDFLRSLPEYGEGCFNQC